MESVPALKYGGIWPMGAESMHLPVFMNHLTELGYFEWDGMLISYLLYRLNISRYVSFMAFI